MTAGEKDGEIAIVGGGIGGLTAALSLQHKGFHVSVFERVEALREVGAGLVVSGPSMNALDFLGVGDRIRALAGERPPNGYFDLKHYATGQVLAAGLGAAQQGSYAVHRADLQMALLDAVVANDPAAVHVDHEFRDLVQDAEGVTASFTNGTSVRADALIGCDGVGSTVRSHVFGSEPVVFTGKVSFRGLIPAERVTPTIYAESGSFYVGPDRMLVLYHVRGTALMNLVAHARQLGWEQEGWSIPASVPELVDLYDDFADPVRETIEAVPAENLFKWALRDREPLPVWTRGRVSMLGDAAHPMLPFLGQGGNMAMEDGMVLGRCLDPDGGIEQGLARYESARKGRATGMQLASRDRAEELMRLSAGDPSSFASVAHTPMPEYDPVTVPV